MSNSLWSHGLQHASFPVIHYLLEFPQTHVHWVDDGIQPSHPLSSPSPLALNLSQHQSLFQLVGSSHQVVKVLELLLGITHAVLARDSAHFMFLNFLLLENELTKQTFLLQRFSLSDPWSVALNAIFFSGETVVKKSLNKLNIQHLSKLDANFARFSY